jgi:hypothetical protein
MLPMLWDKMLLKCATSLSQVRAGCIRATTSEAPCKSVCEEIFSSKCCMMMNYIDEWLYWEGDTPIEALYDGEMHGLVLVVVSCVEMG